MAIEVERDYILRWAKINLSDYKAKIAAMDYIYFTKETKSLFIKTGVRVQFYGELLSFGAFLVVFKEFERIFLNTLRINIDKFLVEKNYDDHFVITLPDFPYSDYVFPDKVESEDELETYLQEFVKHVYYFETVVFPSLANINKMAEYVGRVPFEKAGEIVVGGTYPIQYFKKLAILKWGGNEEKYEEYKKGMEVFIEEDFTDLKYGHEAPLYKQGFQNLIYCLEHEPNPFL